VAELTTTGAIMAKKSKRKPRARGDTEIYGFRTGRGEKMLKCKYRLVSQYALEYRGTLLETNNIGKIRLAIFSVPKRVNRR
jgi:hypothetical protein